MNQKECVFKFVKQVMGEVEGEYKPSKDQRVQIITLITDSIVKGETEYGNESTDFSDVVKIRTYSNGLLSNWLRKDERLNGGVKYEIKNPGSRAGSSDPVIREMKKLKANLILAGQTDKINVIDQAIAKRVSELPTKAKSKVVKIDLDKIPEELRHLFDDIKTKQ